MSEDSELFVVRVVGIRERVLVLISRCQVHSPNHGHITMTNNTNVLRHALPHRYNRATRGWGYLG